MKIDRLIGILTYLLQNEKATAGELAGRFEVSHRTVLRDIDSLTLAGIPIVTIQGNNGGISIMSGYKLDKSVLTIDELQNIITNKDMEFSEPYEARFLFDKSVRFRLIEDYGLNCYRETDEGLYLKLNYSNRDYIISWILGFGDKVTVLEPQDFKDEIKQIAKNILDKYS